MYVYIIHESTVNSIQLKSELEDIPRSDSSHVLYLLYLVKFLVRTSSVDDRKGKRNDENTNGQTISNLQKSTWQACRWVLGRTGALQILMVRLIAEKAKRKSRTFYNCFVGFQKAFDSVKRKIIWATP